MSARHLSSAALAASVVALAACGSGKQVNTATYTCGDFNKSLKTAGDNTSGNFINKLRKQAGLGQSKELEVRELSLAIYLSCRGKPASTRPATAAIANAKRIKAGQVTLHAKPPAQKKSSK